MIDDQLEKVALQRTQKPEMSRRNFLQGATGTLGAAVSMTAVEGLAAAPESPAVPAGGAAAAPSAALIPGTPLDPNYPPALQGMRGQTDAAFKAAHALRDGSLQVEPTDTGEHYDLVVVGAGMSGLAAAYYFRKRLPNSRVLILESHDDFGGHACRNEFTVDGRLQIVAGGAQVIHQPNTYSPEGKTLLADIGIDQARCVAATAMDNEQYARMNLGLGAFFDRENWGTDRLVKGYPGQFVSGVEFGGPGRDLGLTSANLRDRWTAFLEATPLDRATRADLLSIAADQRDYLSGLTVDEKIARLRKMSYRAWLKDVLRVGEEALKFHHQQMGWFVAGSAAGPDTYSAWFAYRVGLGGFQGMGLPVGAQQSADFLPDEELGIPVVLPDGMGGVARLLVRWLIPGSLPGNSMEDAVTARLNYGALDAPRNSVRLRLQSTTTNVRHIGDPASATNAVVTYVKDGKGYSVRTRGVIMACFNAMVPHLCPELSKDQAEALHWAVRKPLIVANLALRNWRPFVKAGVAAVAFPTAFFKMCFLNTFPGLGAYQRPQSPDEPTVVIFTSGWETDGLAPREQARLGRAQMLGTSLQTYEHKAINQLQLAFGRYGFNARRDVAGFTVNRWAHGYAIGANELYDPPWTREELPWVRARKRFGLIAIANSDAGAIALAQGAFDQAHRAVNELIQDVVRPQSDLHYAEWT